MTIAASNDAGYSMRDAAPRDLPSVAIVLVNWNSLRDALDCLRSLSEIVYDGKYSVIAVDNGSKDRSEVSIIRATSHSPTVIENAKNLGFTGGNNVGIRRALADGADYILCLNTDTRVAPDFLTRLVAAMENDTHAGIAGPAVYNMAHPELLATLGCGINFECLNPTVYHLQDYDAKVLADGDPFDVPFVEGCALMMRRAAAEAVRGFDDAFFAYEEDADLCLRARAQGWRTIAVPAARIWHRHNDGGSNSFESASGHYGVRNSWLLLRRHATKQQFRRAKESVKQGMKAMWLGFAQQCAFAPTEASDPERVKHITGSTTLFAICLLGFSGPRWKYRYAENMIRVQICAACRVIMAAGSVIFRLNRTRHKMFGRSSHVEN